VQTHREFVIGSNRRGVTDMPGLYFLGLSRHHTRGSAT
jgi:hypothetical protein